jgi:peptidoglycan/xylan/chitin deacetylase (PgdA/CDA1 family)
MKKLFCVALALAAGISVAHAEPQPPHTARPACGPDALGTSRTLTVGVSGGPEIGLESYPRTLPLGDHEVVLTFDDGPAATTPAVLDALAHACVKATFFLIGRNAAAQPLLVQRELADGHTLGHHTFSHPARTLRRMTTAAAEADIERGFQADDLAAYGVAAATPRVAFFRFPGFADTKDLDAWLASRDIAVFGTDIWAYDWLEESPDQELGILMRQLDKARKGIILLHDTRPSTARMLPALLRALKAGGYKIVQIVPGPGVAETVAAPKGWSSETDRIIAEVFSRDMARVRPRFVARFAMIRQRVHRHAAAAWTTRAIAKARRYAYHPAGHRRRL